jgi:pullulanase
VPVQATLDARAAWLNERWIRWPRPDSNGRFRLYHSADAQIVHRIGQTVTGADGALELSVFGGAVSLAEPARFSHVGSGIVLQVGEADRARLDALVRGQLVLVHEDSAGRVRDATTAQVAGLLDARYPAAVTHRWARWRRSGRTRFDLWAPTARSVLACLHASDAAPAERLLPLQRDASTGIWSSALDEDLRGRYFTYLVDVHVPNTGIVRNRVTDPYALSLGLDSRRALLVDLDDPALKPPGWDAKRAPAKVQAQTDMVIYELHVRDFSINDASVSPPNRGKYLAFTENGQRRHAPPARAVVGRRDRRPPAAGVRPRHRTRARLRHALAVRRAGRESQQAAVGAVKDRDCFNWGYDPWHYTAPEGSYASDASDGRLRVLEFRRMVQALHEAGLRVGMDVVYNHTTPPGRT